MSGHLFTLDLPPALRGFAEILKRQNSEECDKIYLHKQTFVVFVHVCIFALCDSICFTLCHVNLNI